MRRGAQAASHCWYSARFVGWFGISSLQVYGDRLEHVAIVGLMLVQGVEIAVYTARCGWLAMFSRAFPGETTKGAQS